MEKKTFIYFHQLSTFNSFHVFPFLFFFFLILQSIYFQDYNGQTKFISLMKIIVGIQKTFHSVYEPPRGFGPFPGSTAMRTMHHLGEGGGYDLKHLSRGGKKSNRTRNGNLWPATFLLLLLTGMQRQWSDRHGADTPPGVLDWFCQRVCTVLAYHFIPPPLQAAVRQRGGYLLLSHASKDGKAKHNCASSSSTEQWQEYTTSKPGVGMCWTQSKWKHGHN